MRMRVFMSVILGLVLILTACSSQQPTAPAQSKQETKPATSQQAEKPASSQQAEKPASEKSGVKPAAEKQEPKPAAKVDTAAIESFYKGKTITLIVSHSPGGGYDLYARLLARHLGRNIPGNPTVIVQNMPGGGGILPANHLYNAAAKDGTVIGTVDRGMPLEQAMGTQGVQFDVTKFNWLGSMNEEVSVCVSRSDSPVKTFDDALKMPLRVGGTGPGADTDVFPRFLNATVGAKFDLITGYPGTNEVSIAMERNEIQGRCGWSWSSVKTSGASLLKENKINILVQIALHKHPELPNVPLVMDYAKDEKTKNMFEVVFARQTMGRPYLAPPGVPKERVDALRKAFMDTLNDPQFKEEAEKSKQEITPVTGEELQQLVERLMKTPKDQVEMVAKYIKSQQ